MPNLNTLTTQAQEDPDALWRSMLAGLDARRARLRPLWEMTVAQRQAAMARGELTLEQCCAWAAREPDQVAEINGEFAFIAAFCPEACIACPVCGGEVTDCGPDGQLRAHPDERHPDFGTRAGRVPGAVPSCPASGLTLDQAKASSTVPERSEVFA